MHSEKRIKHMQKPLRARDRQRDSDPDEYREHHEFEVARSHCIPPKIHTVRSMETAPAKNA